MAAGRLFWMVKKLGMKIYSIKYLKLLILIFFVVNLILRVWQIDRVPVSLFGDEIDVGLQAHSILTTGKDYLGNKFPVMFHSFSEYRLPMQLYLTIPFIKIFGLSEIGVRCASIGMGIFSIFAFYLLTRQLFGKRIGVISALFMAYSPWHFLYSRQANDAGILLPFVLLGTYYFIKSKASSNFYKSVISFALSIYAYAISSLFTPLYFLGSLLIYRNRFLKMDRKIILKAFLLGVIIVSPYFVATLSGSTTKRFSNIGLLNTKTLSEEVVSSRIWSNTDLARFIYNKPTVAIQNLFNGYMQALSSDFLFAEGDPNPRQSVSDFGMMYHFDFTLVVLGLISIYGIYKKEPMKRKYLYIIISWFLLSPIPSILTRDGGTHASRLILILPPLLIFSALGFDLLLSSFKKNYFSKLALIFVLAWMLFDVTKFVHRYFVIWPNESWRFWQTGFEETLSYAREHDQEYERIIFNNTYEPILPRFLFWYGYDMDKFQNQFEGDVHIPKILPGLDGFKLGDKYYFGELNKPIEPLAQPGTLVVASAEKDVTNPQIFNRTDLKLIKTIYAPVDELPIFYLFTAN
jgi:4-amino-4-deoxy-L-arabinose transferase-like glycosyltransferase